MMIVGVLSTRILEDARLLPVRPRRSNTMVMPDTMRRYTVEEVLAFPADGNRYELVDGELLVTPAPRPLHQRVVTRLAAFLETYLNAQGDLAVVFVSPADISWGRDKLVQPDLFVVPAAEVSGSWKSYKTLLLAIEVLSPGSARYDRVTKRRLYQRQDVGTYWVVDMEAKMVEVWHPDDERPEIVTDALHWCVAEDAEELVIELGELFREPPRSQ
jgi:Uma2 family endonuclease